MKNNMKEYLVESNQGQWTNTWIVLAHNSKEAIQTVWDYVGFDSWNSRLKEENKRLGYQANAMFLKTEFTARSIGSLHNENGKVIEIQ